VWCEHMRAETTLRFWDGEWMGIRVCVMLGRWWDVRTDRAGKEGREGEKVGAQEIGSWEEYFTSRMRTQK
jgi:hypothetical protein